MNKKIFENSRFCPKGDIEANWNKAVGFIPLDKEIIIYKADSTHPAARFKVGDGKTVVQELPFSGTDIAAIEKLIEYVDNAVTALPQVDWNQNDETAKDYIKNRPFYVSSVLIEWDGIVGDREIVKIPETIISEENVYVVKISDSILTYEDYLGATVIIKYQLEEENIQVTEDMLIPKDYIENVGVCGLSGPMVTVIDVNKVNTILGENIFKIPGTYSFYTPDVPAYISSFSSSRRIVQLDEKFIPDSIARIETLSSVTQRATKANILSIFN